MGISLGVSASAAMNLTSQLALTLRDTSEVVDKFQCTCEGLRWSKETCSLLVSWYQEADLPPSPLYPWSFGSGLWGAGPLQPRSSHHVALPCGLELRRLRHEASPQKRQIALKAERRKIWERRGKTKKLSTQLNKLSEF